jgi:hypothetical protein
MKSVVVLTADPMLADDIARSLGPHTEFRSGREPMSLARFLQPRNHYIAFVDLEMPDHTIRSLSLMMRMSTAHVRMIGVRRRFDVYRDSMLISQGWIDRIVTDIRDRETLRKLELLPRAE